MGGKRAGGWRTLQNFPFVGVCWGVGVARGKILAKFFISWTWLIVRGENLLTCFGGKGGDVKGVLDRYRGVEVDHPVGV